MFNSKFSIFSIPPIRARVAVMYFMAKSCIHTVRLPEPNQNMPYLSPISQASTKFRGNGQIPRLGSKFRVLRKTVVPTYLFVRLLWRL